MKRKWCVIILMMLSVTLFTACSATELEDRCFPMMVGVGYELEEEEVTFVAGFPRVGTSGSAEPQINEIQVATVRAETFAKAKQIYEKHLNKESDYNHLKVLVLEEVLLKEKETYVNMLKDLEQMEEFPRNTYVCIVEDIEELMEIEKNLPQDLGTYLEEYLKNHEARKEQFSTLGDLIDEEKNGKMRLEIPVLFVKENYVEWERNLTIRE